MPTEKQDAAGGQGYWTSTFQSLRHRNFQFYCLGVVVSLTGSLMQQIVVAWLAFQMTHSSFVLGAVLFSYQIPMLALGVAGGWAADRFNRKHIVMITQALALLVTLVFMVLAMAGLLDIWHLFVLSALLGALVAFEIPARFAMIPQLVEGRDIGNAFALDSLLFYCGRVIGPALGALALATIGASGCFAVNCASYLVELITLAAIVPAASAGGASVALKDAFAFVTRTPDVRRQLLLVAVFGFCGVYIPLMPAFTAALGGDATTNGILIAASEVGAMIGSLLLANRAAQPAFADRLRRLVGYAGIGFAVFMALFAIAGSVSLATILMVPVGVCMSGVLIGGHALVQARTDDKMRGVVSTVFWMYCYFSMLTIGSPVAGWLAEQIGLVATFVAGSVLCLVSACVYLISDIFFSKENES